MVFGFLLEYWILFRRGERIPVLTAVEGYAFLPGLYNFIKGIISKYRPKSKVRLTRDG